MSDVPPHAGAPEESVLAQSLQQQQPSPMTDKSKLIVNNPEPTAAHLAEVLAILNNSPDYRNMASAEPSTDKTHVSPRSHAFPHQNRFHLNYGNNNSNSSNITSNGNSNITSNITSNSNSNSNTNKNNNLRGTYDIIPTTSKNSAPTYKPSPLAHQASRSALFRRLARNSQVSSFRQSNSRESVSQNAYSRALSISTKLKRTADDSTRRNSDDGHDDENQDDEDAEVVEEWKAWFVLPLAPASSDDVNDQPSILPPSGVQSQQEQESAKNDSMVVNTSISHEHKGALSKQSSIPSATLSLNSISNSVSSAAPRRGQTAAIPEDKNRAWNHEYQLLYDRPVASPFDMKTRAAAMETLVNEFTTFSRRVAECLVDDIHVPPENQRIKPANLPGIMGGIKYLYGNVLFKFATDRHGLFGEVESLAYKSGV